MTPVCIWCVDLRGAVPEKEQKKRKNLRVLQEGTSCRQLASNTYRCADFI